MSTKGRKYQIGAKDISRKICQHDSFSVNYSLFSNHPWRNRGESRIEIDERLKRMYRKRTHIRRLPPGRVVTLTKLPNIVSLTYGARKVLSRDSPTVVKNPLLSTTLGGLLLLLLFYLRGGGLDFAGSSERSVNCKYKVSLEIICRYICRLIPSERLTFAHN
jgi:hypothetical protein